MRVFKAAMLSAAMAAAGAIGANAAEPMSTTPVNPPQVATNPGLPYSYAHTPGPKAGPSTWIPSTPSSATPSATAPNSGEDSGAYYSKKGFGPAPN